MFLSLLESLMSAEKLNLCQRQDRVQGGANVRWPGTGFLGCKGSNFSIVKVSSPTPDVGVSYQSVDFIG